MLYEFSAFIRVHADDQQQAEGIVDAFVDAANASPELSLSLEDGEPTEEEED